MEKGLDTPTFQAVIMGIGILMSVIGFLIAWILKSFHERQKNHELRLNRHDQLIEQNKNAITANSEKDSLIRNMLEKSHDEVKQSVGQLIKTVGELSSKVEIFIEMGKNKP